MLVPGPLFFVPKVQIATDGIEPLPERIPAVRNYRTRTCQNEVQAFFAIASFVPAHFFLIRSGLCYCGCSPDGHNEEVRKVSVGCAQEEYSDGLKQQLTGCQLLSQFKKTG